MGVAAAIVVGYLLGTFPSADLVARVATHGAVDIRAVGSGNPGAFNAMRSIGKGWGAVVLVLDVAKGLATGFAGRALGGDVGAYLGATAAIVGHILPVWTRFRGGKGVATAAGACAAVFPAFVPVNVALALATAVGARRAVVGTVLASVLWVLAALAWTALGWSNLWGPAPSGWLVVFAVAGAGLVLGAFAAAATAARRGDPAAGPRRMDRVEPRPGDEP
jgi:glycerol-3-phosphate acyltransferase PlsY